MKTDTFQSYSVMLDFRGEKYFREIYASMFTFVAGQDAGHIAGYEFV